MRLAIGSDHAGFHLKHRLIAELDRAGHEILDFGTYDEQAADYPDSAEAVGRAIREGRTERGIVICGSGVGASAAANKLPGIRAGLCHDTYSAKQGVEDDDMNVLVLGRPSHRSRYGPGTRADVPGCQVLEPRETHPPFKQSPSVGGSLCGQ